MKTRLKQGVPTLSHAHDETIDAALWAPAWDLPKPSLQVTERTAWRDQGAG